MSGGSVSFAVCALGLQVAGLLLLLHMAFAPRAGIPGACFQIPSSDEDTSQIGLETALTTSLELNYPSYSRILKS